MISIYADGSSTGRVGPGGYGWIIVRDETEILAWSYGGSPVTTNNLMEMEGAICGLEAAQELGLPPPGELIELVSDSQYTLGIASGAYIATKNLESAERLKILASKVSVRLRWVRGHQGNQYNEHCDKLAKQGKDENTSPDIIAKRIKKQARKTRAKTKKPHPQ